MRPLPLLLALLATAASAQVNTERMRRTADDEGVALSLSAAGAFASGNTDYVQVGVGGRLDVRGGVHEAFLVGESQFARADGDDVEDRSFLHARYNRDLGPVVVEAFAQVERDRQQLLEARSLLGAGVRLELVDTDGVGLALGLTPMLEHERLSEAAREDAATVVRLSSYLSARARLGAASSVWAVGYVQPQVDEVEDVRVLAQAGVEVEVMRWLRLRTRVHVRHDALPPLGVGPTDVRIEQGLIVAFPGRPSGNS